MTNQLDTAAIRAQMEALAGFTPGPWRPHNQPGDWGLWGAHRIHVADASPYDWDQCIAQVEYQTPYCMGEKPSVIEAARTAACNASLIAAAPDMHNTILALCAALDDMQAENKRMRAALCDVIGCDHHNFCDGGPPKYVRIARAALAQKEGK